MEEDVNETNEKVRKGMDRCMFREDGLITAVLCGSITSSPPFLPRARGQGVIYHTNVSSTTDMYALSQDPLL